MKMEIKMEMKMNESCGLLLRHAGDDNTPHRAGEDRPLPGHAGSRSPNTPDFQ